MPRPTLVARLCFGVLWLVVSLGAQSPSPQQPVFRSRADLVRVEVVVVDKDGHAVRGLKQDAFAIADRKKPQTIATFSEETHEQTAASAATPAFPPTLKIDVSDNQATRADRLVVVVIDDLHIFQGRTDKAKELARQVITQLGADASMAVLFTSGEHSTQVTSDRSEWLAAAETLKGRQSWRRPHEASDTQTARIDADDDPAVIAEKIDAAQRHSLQDFFDNMTQYKTLQDAARMLGQDDTRRKAFVLLTEGISLDLRGVFEGPVTPCEMDGQKPCYHERSLREMMESLRRSSVATYALDPRGHVSSQDLLHEATGPAGGGMLASAGGKPSDDDSPFRLTNPIRLAQDGLTIMAKASGGFAVTDSDDFTSGIQRIIEDIDHYYEIGFYPADPTGKGYRRLDVTVPGHPDWTLRYRQGYEPGGPPPPPKNADPLAALSAGVMPKATLPLRISAMVLPGAGTLVHVDAALELTAPTKDLLESDARLHDSVSYEVIVVDDKKSKVTSRSANGATFVLKPSAGPMPDTVRYQIPLALDLAPGQYQLRASAMSTKLAAGGSVYLTVDVPDFSKAAIALGSVVIGYANGSHVPVGRVMTTSVEVAATSSAGATGAPIAPRGLPFDPSLDRAFLRADTLRVHCDVSRLSPSVTVQTAVEIVDTGDQIVKSFDGSLSANDPALVDLSISLKELEPGPYRLRVRASDGAHSALREVGLIVR